MKIIKRIFRRTICSEPIVLVVARGNVKELVNARAYLGDELSVRSRLGKIQLILERDGTVTGAHNVLEWKRVS